MELPVSNVIGSDDAYHWRTKMNIAYFAMQLIIIAF